MQLSQAREALAAAAAPSVPMVVFAGGYSSLTALRKTYYDTVDAYNPVTGTWSLLPPLSAPRQKLAGVHVTGTGRCVCVCLQLQRHARYVRHA